jgi:cytochrome bd ubiquinol oxidase subunit II
VNTLEVLQFLIYFVFMFSLVAYATLDGFDLGVGCLHLFVKNDKERRVLLNAIGPVWDGNTTWIVIGGGVLFAGFPKVFSILMAGFYTPVMIFLFGIMLRGAAVEFRSKEPGKFWRNLWDYCFFFASFLLTINIGLLLGNLIHGLPLNERGEFVGGFMELLGPYPIVVSLFGLSVFMMHGSIYLLMKTEGALHIRIRSWVKRSIALFLILWVITTVFTFASKVHMIHPFFNHPSLIIFALLSLASILFIPQAIAKKKDGLAFIASSLSIVFLLILFVIGTFPYFVYSTIDPLHNSLTLFNASASQLTLFVLMIIALTGIPLSFFYFSYLHRTFRGKVKIDSTSY